MATSLYTSFLTRLLNGTMGNLTTATLKLAAVTSSYIPDVSNHTTLESISSYVLGTTTLSSVTVTNGVLTCANPIFSGITSGTATYVVLYLDSGTASTSYLIGYDGSATNLPLTFTGSSVSCTINASGLVKLVQD